MPGQFGVIGAGNMAEATIRGAIKAGILQPSDIIASDPSPQRRSLFDTQLRVATTTDNAALADCEKILLSVKPQMMPTALDSIAPSLRGDALLITIAAGVKTAFIHGKLGGKGRIVRVMPNTPMLVGCGATALAGGPGATEADLTWATRLFAACGKTIQVAEESLDAVTAVSGSGPAYFFYLMEAMVQAGIDEGLSREDSLLLTAQTCLGSAQMLLETGESPESLRKKVTSPNGTTQAAIEKMDAAGVKPALVAAVRRAAERSRELGR